MIQSLLIDEADLALISMASCWIDSLGYPVVYMNRRRIRIHRLLMGDPKGKIVDHINLNKLDCRRSNLRVTDRFGNARNSKFRSHNTSGFRGVHFCRLTRRWRAQIVVRARSINLGRYDTAELAAGAYDSAAMRYHGEFARLNFVDERDTGKVGRGCGEHP